MMAQPVAHESVEQPEPVAVVESEPVVVVEPEPVAEIEPEPVAVVEPEPAPAPVAPKPKPAPVELQPPTQEQIEAHKRAMQAAQQVEDTDWWTKQLGSPARSRVAPDLRQAPLHFRRSGR